MTRAARSLLVFLLLASVASASGCFMVVTKTLGTIRGAYTTIEVIKEKREMPADARVGVITLTTSGDGSADQERYDLFMESLCQVLKEHDLYDPEDGTVTVVIELLSDLDLPTRKRTVIAVDVSTPEGELGEARITAAHTGLGTREEVAREFASSVAVFLEELRDFGSRLDK